MNRHSPRMVRICPAPQHLEDFRAEAALDVKSFDDQIACLRRANLMLPGGWAAVMAREGYDVFETIANDARLQETWARGNKITPGPSGVDVGIDILIAQLQNIQPDVIFIYAGAFVLLSRDVRERMRAVCHKDVLITGLWGDELPAIGGSYTAFLGDLDFVFCANSSYEKKMVEAGIPAQVLGNCFDDTISYTKPAVKSRDLIFSGMTGYGYPDHIRRYELLKVLMSRTPLEIWTKEPRIPVVSLLFGRPVVWVLRRLPSGILRVLKTLARGLGLHKVARAMELGISMRQSSDTAKREMGGLFHPKKNYFIGKKSLHSSYLERVNGMLPDCSDYYSLLAGARLVLNIHRDEDADFGNIRCFEVTGLGSCLVTDRGTELAEFFDIENDIVTFESADECVEKVLQLLSQPSEIKRISDNGRRATLKYHSVAARGKTIAETLQMLHNAAHSGRAE